MTLKLEERENRILMRLRVTPGSRKARIVGEHAGALKLHVSEPPDKGRANEGVITLLAEVLGIAPRQIDLVSGHSSHDKLVAISGIDEETIRKKLAP